MSTITEKRATFRHLHESGCFVIPNPWDLGSARVLAQLGFPALATTSCGFAWTIARPDHGVSLDEMLVHLRAISEGVAVPVNADFERGFATAPEIAGHGTFTHLSRAVPHPEVNRSFTPQ